MGRLWSKSDKEISAESIRGVKSVDGSLGVEKDEVKIDFPTANIGDDHIFDEEDIVLAKELLTANREQLTGTATLYLAVAENDENEFFATMATAYMLAALLRPASE